MKFAFPFETTGTVDEGVSAVVEVAEEFFVKLVLLLLLDVESCGKEVWNELVLLGKGLELEAAELDDVADRIEEDADCVLELPEIPDLEGVLTRLEDVFVLAFKAASVPFLKYTFRRLPAPQ